MFTIRFVSFLVLLGAALVSGPASGLIDHLVPIYSEDFEGESSFPTTPEFDPILLGGMSDLPIGNSSPSATFDGSNLSIGLSATAGPFFVEQLIAGPFSAFAPLMTVGARAVLSGYDATVNGVGQTFAGLVLSGPGGVVTANLQRFVSSLNPADDLLGLVVSDLDLLTGATNSFDFVVLTGATRAAVEAGQAVEIELLFDGVSGSASAAATIGTVQIATAAITPTFVSVESLGVFAGVTNVFVNSIFGPIDLGRDDALSVDFASYEVRSIPEPAISWLFGTGLAVWFGVSGRRDRAAHTARQRA